MENAQMEIAAIEAAVKEGVEAELRELSELQLLLVGGGVGEVIVG